MNIMPDQLLQSSLDRITRLAAQVLDVPIALATLYDAGYQRYHSSYHGLRPDQQEACAALLHTTMTSGIARKVENIYTDTSQKRDASWTDAVPEVQSYVLLPVRTATQTTLGALGVLDTRSRPFTAAQQQTLEDLAGTIADIASWMPVASARREQEANWRGMVEHYPNPILISIADQIAYANQAAATLCGTDAPLDLVGRCLDSFADPARREPIRHHLADAQRGLEILPLEYELHCLNGERRTVEARSSLVRFAGQPAVQTALCDVTERNQTEQALREREQRFRTLVQNASDIIALIDADAIVQYESPAVERILGYSPGTLVNQNVFDLVHPDDLRSVQAEVVRMLQVPDRMATVRCRLAHAEGRWVHLEGMLRNLLDDPSMHGIVINMRDVTERQQYEQKLHTAKDRAEEMLRLKSAFLTNMSHEIRTPLTGILGLAQILSEEVPDPLQEFAQAINHSGRRLLETLTAILELSRLEAGSYDLHPSRFDLIPELTQSLNPFQRQAGAKGVHLALETPVRSLPVEMDRGALNSILQNLVANALKFTESGRITLAVEQRGPDVVLAVHDTGIGISEAFLPYIFDDFKQESEGVGREYEGAGLGLTLVQGMVELMDGRIEVQTRKGHGSTFTVRLPGIATAPLPASPAARTHQRPRVLVVEDNAATQTYITYTLRTMCEVTLAADADAARQAWRATHPDLVLMDINLGAGKGIGVELLKELRSDPAYASIPVVAVTAYALPGDRERFLNEGFDDYLSKPFTKEQLLDTIAKMYPNFNESGMSSPVRVLLR